MFLQQVTSKTLEESRYIPKPQKTFYTTDVSWIDWNPIALEKTPNTPFGKAEKMLQKVDDQRLLLSEYLGGKRRFQKEEFEKCEPSKPKE